MPKGEERNAALALIWKRAYPKTTDNQTTRLYLGPTYAGEIQDWQRSDGSALTTGERYRAWHMCDDEGIELCRGNDFDEMKSALVDALRSSSVQEAGWNAGEREDVHEALFGHRGPNEKGGFCANLGPYVQGVVKQLNEANDLLAKMPTDLVEHHRDLLEQSGGKVPVAAFPAPGANVTEHSTSGIVERLRTKADEIDRDVCNDPAWVEVAFMREAADEIERLQRIVLAWERGSKMSQHLRTQDIERQIQQNGELIRLREALSQVNAFVGIMFGDGPDAVIPETVGTPLGIPVKLGAIMRDVDAALSKAVTLAQGESEPKASEATPTESLVNELRQIAGHAGHNFDAVERAAIDEAADRLSTPSEARQPEPSDGEHPLIK